MIFQVFTRNIQEFLVILGVFSNIRKFQEYFIRFGIKMFEEYSGVLEYFRCFGNFQKLFAMRKSNIDLWVSRRFSDYL
jgi:hypothetical protein